MKTYNRHRTSAEVLAASRAQNILVDTERFDQGWDHLLLFMPGPNGLRCPVLYNVCNGRFFCASEGYPQFSSDQAQYDGQPWFDALLDFFYTNEDLPK
jgi:hypothetical protein